MTQYPECYFAREMGICYATIAMITDYDIGLRQSVGMSPGGINKVIKIFNDNIDRCKKYLIEIAENQFNNKCPNCSMPQLKEYYKKIYQSK